MVCFALQPKGKGKLKRSQMCHQALDLRAFCMLCSLGFFLGLKRACFWISAGFSPSPQHVIGNKKCSGVVSAEKEIELPLLCPGGVH